MSNESIPRRSESDYHFGRVLGEGSFSTVYVARELASRKEYASESSKFHKTLENISLKVGN